MFNLFKKSDLSSVSAAELPAVMKEQDLLIDVRSPEEYYMGHIKKAKNVPLDKLTEYQPAENKKIYVICQSGMRSKQGAKILQRRGYDIVNVKDGMNAWNGSVKRGR